MPLRPKQGPELLVEKCTLTPRFYNLSNDSGAGFLTASGDLINLPAMLAPLAYNGGPTKTHDPLVGSPAAYAGNPVGAPLTDQRGYPRLATSVDIGAIESDVLFRDGFDLL